MHDTFLLNKISNALKQICSENKISKINSFIIEVNNESHINEVNLIEHLKMYNKDNIANNIQIEIQRSNIEEQTAIIKSIQGETFG